MIDFCSIEEKTEIADAVFSESIDTLDHTDWKSVVEDKNIYLSLPYLSAIEQSLPVYEFRYIIFYDTNQEPIGVGYCQVVKITSADIDVNALSERMGGMLPKSLISTIDLRVLICGNAFASGENGFFFKEGVDLTQALKKLSDAVDEVHLAEKKKGKKIAITLIKEFWPESFDQVAKLKDCGCSEIKIDVNMVLTLDSTWKSFDDYLAALNSKFRTKAKQVLKKSRAIEIVDFDVQTIEDRLGEIDELYNTIVDRASFTFGRLTGATLLAIKKALGDDFYFRGYYLANKLIGFSTATAFDDVLDGNFIGLDYDYNREYSVYQRILYDFINHAIRIGAKSLKLGRTAEEIKSGVGAQPVDMVFYARHSNKVTNAILKPFVQNLKPSDFELRRPFKAEFYND